jgi:hypothetical protein
MYVVSSPTGTGRYKSTGMRERTFSYVHVRSVQYGIRILCDSTHLRAKSK